MLYVGKGSPDILPVSAVLAFLVVRVAGPGPLICFKNGRPLIRQRFISAVRDALEASRIQASCYSGNSFRIGAVMTAAVQDSVIRTLDRWKSLAYWSMSGFHISSLLRTLLCCFKIVFPCCYTIMNHVICIDSPLCMCLCFMCYTSSTCTCVALSLVHWFGGWRFTRHPYLVWLAGDFGSFLAELNGTSARPI